MEIVNQDIVLCDLETSSSSVPSPVDGAFSNAVVWRQLEKCLNFADLKCLRLVSRNFNRNIMQETNFKSRVVIGMKAYKIEQEEFRPTTTWKHFKIQCFSDEDIYEDVQDNEADYEDEVVEHEELVNELNLDWLYNLLENAESLSITTMSAFTASRKSTTILPSVVRLLQSPRQLKSLVINGELLGRNRKSVFTFLKSSVRNPFENLTEMQIFVNEEFVERSGHYDYYGCAESLRILSQFVKQLQVLKVSTSCTSDRLSAKILFPLLKIIDGNSKQLLTLEVDDNFFWHDNFSFIMSALKTEGHISITSMTFPLLKSLRIQVCEAKHVQGSILKFLKAHPLIENLDLTIFPVFPDELLNLVASWGNHLKRLRIETKRFETGHESMWSFLPSFTKLEEIGLIMPKNDRSPSTSTIGNVKAICQFLPRKVKRISFQGICDLGPENTVIESDLASINFLLVTSLNLSGCGLLVDDVLMGIICRKFVMLRFLDVSYSYCTDYGFTGTHLDGSSSEFSIKALKGLRSLTMKRCGTITDAVCLNAIEFVELVHLDLSRNNNITPEGCMAILERNPSLETFKADHQLKTESLKERFPRLESIVCIERDFFQDSDDEDDGDEDSDYDNYFDNESDSDSDAELVGIQGHPDLDDLPVLNFLNLLSHAIGKGSR